VRGAGVPGRVGQPVELDSERHRGGKSQ
jgi:hypothetical protein